MSKATVEPTQAQIDTAAEAILKLSAELNIEAASKKRCEYYAKATLTAILNAGYVIITREEYDRINN